MKVRVLEIVRGTTVDGPGFRTAIYMAGCRHQCRGCHNPQSWDFDSGEEMAISDIMEVIREEGFDVTLTGGDPLYHPQIVREIINASSELGLKVWVYTGYTMEQINANPTLFHAIEGAEAIVDGPYMESLRDTDLRFRGSSNQRIIYLK